MLRDWLGVSTASQDGHQELCLVANATACNSMKQVHCETRGAFQQQASEVTMSCAWMPMQPHATACHSYNVKLVELVNSKPTQAL